MRNYVSLTVDTPVSSLAHTRECITITLCVTITRCVCVCVCVCVCARARAHARPDMFTMYILICPRYVS